ncbi:hypothetical protein TREES_T100006640 [Tupaia chinensis]|uniref:Uncharacterized protein n=1 Tax=Tupaia chinensis TaxID=246437 RepID=L9KNF3_TUPCH|nr:hypothetical protein TREES_T100006640 [Tupaia chinensis]
MLNVRNLASLNVSGRFLARKAKVKLPRAKKPRLHDLECQNHSNGFGQNSRNSHCEHKAKCDLLEDTGGCIWMANEEQGAEEAWQERDEQNKAENLVLVLTMGVSRCFTKIPKTTAVRRKKHRAMQAMAVPKASSKAKNVTDLGRQ